MYWSILTAIDLHIRGQALPHLMVVRTVLLRRWRCTGDVVLEDSVSDGKSIDLLQWNDRTLN